MDEKGIRINKFLSEAGVCSRREGDKLVDAKRVTVDGEYVTTGTRVLPGQHVFVDGKEVCLEEEEVVLLFNKPRGIVCTAETGKG